MRRRELLRRGSLVLVLGAHQIARGATILAVRLWPAPDYSRVTIESDGLLTTTHTVVGSPPRVASASNLLLGGAAAKSAQVPFHTWLPGAAW